MTDPVDANWANVELAYADVHKLSLELIDHMMNQDTEVPLGLVAVGMTLGRLFAPGVLQPEEESKFIQDILDWCGAYFAKGKVN